MTDWPDLSSDEQTQWSALAEIREGRPATWNDVSPAKRLSWLDQIRRERQPNSWGDLAEAEQEDRLAKMDRIDTERQKKVRDALATLIAHYGVGGTPDNPDYHALFIAALRSVRTSSERGVGRPELSQQELFEFSRDYLTAARDCQSVPIPRRQAAALDMLLEGRWKYMTMSGETRKHTRPSLRYRMEAAQKHELIRKMLEGVITAEECGNEIAAVDLLTLVVNE